MENSFDLIEKFNSITQTCFELFVKKNADYGPTWLLYRFQSINDEIWRKVKRIRTLEQNNDNAHIREERDSEYIGIINYSIMFLIKLSDCTLPSSDELVNDISLMHEIDNNDLFSKYTKIVDNIRDLLIKKNHDYGDAWQSMTLHSMTDQIIIRNYRIRKILENNGQCTVSEGIASQLCDIINYSVFGLIKMENEHE